MSMAILHGKNGSIWVSDKIQPTYPMKLFHQLKQLWSN